MIPTSNLLQFKMRLSIAGSLSVLFVAILAMSSTASAWVSVPDSARSEGAVHRGEARVETRLITDVTQVAPGDSFRVGVAYRMDSDWHIYWQNPGDAGLPTDVTWSSPDASFGELRWSAPEFFTEEGGISAFGYSGEIVLFAEATASPEATDEITVSAKTDYLACSNACLPGQSRMRRSIPVGPETIKGSKKAQTELRRFSARVPQDAEQLGLATEATFSDGSTANADDVQLALEVIACRDPGESCPNLEPEIEGETHPFFADAVSKADVVVENVYPHPSVRRGWVYDMTATVRSSQQHVRDAISGVLKFRGGDGELVPAYITIPLPTRAEDRAAGGQPPEILTRASTLADKSITEASSSPTAEGSRISIWWALLLAFAGGMVLNLMPCVFPVLAFKVTSFARVARESRRHKLAHGAAYTVGIVGTLSALAVVVIGLRLAGTGVGWGFQFQHPEFAAALSLLLVLFAANLFGAFEVGVQPDSVDEATRQASGLKRSALEGLLAVLLATPCSAPFLGTAVGFALAGSSWSILAIFAVLGLGLAAPFVVLTLVPGWARVLPRPGEWMDHLKHGLGFALLGTVVWLLWIVGRQTGVSGMTAVLAMLIATGFGAWIFGRVQYRPTWQKWGAIGGVVVALAAAGSFVFPLHSEASSSSSGEVSSGSLIDWKPWSEKAVDRALQQGRPVFVDFTADWCLTCKVNEKNAINVKTTAEAAASGNVAMLKADWTDGGASIREELQRHGKGGVPMYLVYSPDRPDSPRVLPEVLTTDLLVDALKAASETDTDD